MVPAKVWGYGRPIATLLRGEYGRLRIPQLHPLGIVCESCCSGESLILGYADEVYGDYASVAELIKNRVIVSSVRPLFFLVPNLPRKIRLLLEL